ncbi:MAG: hypothetical protein N3F64_07680 [Nitrososphaeria archaeon]|nr:hypothetical protein [Nitrososphaeria archaeon]
MNRIKRYSINLNDETCACLRELSTYLGVKEEDIIKLFVETIAFYFPKSYVEEKVDDIVRSFQNTKYDALEFGIRKVLNFG